MLCDDVNHIFLFDIAILDRNKQYKIHYMYYIYYITFQL